MNLVTKYWQNSKHPCPIYAIVSLGRVQPTGYILGWSISRKDARSIQKKLSNNGPSLFVKMEIIT